MEQMPPLWHGLDTHRSTMDSQWRPKWTRGDWTEKRPTRRLKKCKQNFEKRQKDQWGLGWHSHSSNRSLWHFCTTSLSVYDACTCVSGATEALVVIDKLDAVAAASSMARSRKAFIDIPLTVLSNKPWKAGASVAADAVDTLTSVSAAWLRGAWAGGTVVFIHLTPDPCRAARRSYLTHASRK